MATFMQKPATPAQMIELQLELAHRLGTERLDLALRCQRLLLHWWRLGIIQAERERCATEDITQNY